MGIKIKKYVQKRSGLLRCFAGPIGFDGGGMAQLMQTQAMVHGHDHIVPNPLASRVATFNTFTTFK